MELWILTFCCEVFRGVWKFGKSGKPLRNKLLGSRYESLTPANIQSRSTRVSREKRLILQTCSNMLPAGSPVGVSAEHLQHIPVSANRIPVNPTATIREVLRAKNSLATSPTTHGFRGRQ